VIAVDDRSSDATGAILDRMAGSSSNLTVVQVKELPPGWLGKNHALHAGASRAAGEWLLFADADVVMRPAALARAIGYALRHKMDHLAVAPRAVVGGFLANVFLNGFALAFAMHTRPWKVRDPNAKEYIGIGAFNLVRTCAYRAVGGHASIAMRPDDDLKLGKLLKRSGFRSDFVLGSELLCVEWYRSFHDMRKGLMKNLFAVLGYNAGFAVIACLLQFVLFIWPFLAIVITRGMVQWLNIAVVVSACLACASNSYFIKTRKWWCLTLPVAGALTIYLILRAAVLTLRNGGIEWRGTHYSLEQLRSNRF
jgi:glycosyltransferase involved in cell wall biosynthesis